MGEVVPHRISDMSKPKKYLPKFEDMDWFGKLIYYQLVPFVHSVDCQLVTPDVCSCDIERGKYGLPRK